MKKCVAIIINAQISQYAGFVYDSTMMYALTVNAMINDNVDYRDGVQYLKYAKTISFRG